jgi:amidophosphoribosyltransferase
MCGIVGLLVGDDSEAVGPLYEALLALQHRGQDAAGVVTEDGGRFCLLKDNGMVRDVFGPGQLKNLRGSIGIGHVRYPTAGSSSCAEAQPFYVNSPYGIALAHNGNLVGLQALQAELEREFRHINTGSDSEVLLNLLAIELFASLRSPAQLKRRRTEDSGAETPPDPSPLGGPSDVQVFAAVREVMRRCAGAYACVSMIIGYGLLAFRDPNGIRPLCYGRRKVEAGNGAYEYMVASESGALNALGFELLQDVPPGHVLLLRRGREPLLHNCLPPTPARAHTPCVFEYVYFARPDSVIDGVSVYRTRLRMGEKLAENISRTWGTHDIDVVIPVPDTARTAAIECASRLGIPYREGFIKNRYVGRTFIMPAQGLRQKSVRQKLAPIASEFVGRNVLLVDDSIVRGTTSRQIIAMVREAGAKRVYMASAAPPVKFPNVYGIDMPTKTELIAWRHQTSEAIAEEIGADRVIFQVNRPFCLAFSLLLRARWALRLPGCALWPSVAYRVVFQVTRPFFFCFFLAFEGPTGSPLAGMRNLAWRRVQGHIPGGLHGPLLGARPALPYSCAGFTRMPSQGL